MPLTMLVPPHESRGGCCRVPGISRALVRARPYERSSGRRRPAVGTAIGEIA